MIHFISNQTSIQSEIIKSSTIADCVEYCKAKKVLGVDTETEGFDFTCKKMIMFQIGDAQEQFVIDTRHVSIEPLREILEDKDIIKIFHNAKFDYKFIKRWGGINCKNIYDTFLTEKVLHCGKQDYGFSLAKVCERYLNVHLDKEERNKFISLKGLPYTDNQIVYGAKDVTYLIQIREKQIPLLQTHNLVQVSELENRVVRVFAEIEYEGLNINKDRWVEMANKNQQLAEDMEITLDTSVSSDPALKQFVQPVQQDMFAPTLRKTNINWGSPKQVLGVFQTLIPKLEDVNGKNLYKYKYKFSIIKEYIKYKELTKLSNAYGSKFFKYVNSDNKVHTNFQQILDTGRVSSSSPNMQQIPSDNTFRNCFYAPEGWVFVSSDYSSQELNVIAYGSNDPVFLRALINSEDLHSVCAELVFQKEWVDNAEAGCMYVGHKQKCECKKHKELRTKVKTINFGLAYGMGPNKLSDTLQISLQEAKDLIKKYFRAFPSIESFLSELGEKGKRTGNIRTFPPFNRVRWFENWTAKMYSRRDNFMELGSIERASKNTPIQGSSADMTKLALYYIYNEIEKNYSDTVKIVMTVHDQIDTICKQEIAEEWKERMTELMEKAANVIIPNKLLKADTNISKTWEK